MDERREQMKKAAYARLRAAGVPEGEALTEYLARNRLRWKAEQDALLGTAGEDAPLAPTGPDGTPK